MIRTKSGYSLRQVLDAYLILGAGKEAYAPRCIMSMNESGAFLWHLLENGAEKDELVQRMTQEYDVPADTAAADVEKFLAQLREKALIVE